MTASLYRRYAAECLQILATTKDAKNSAALRAMAIAWTDLAELAEGRASALDSKNAEAASGRKVEGRRACEPRLRLICLLFEPPRQFLVTHRDCAHHIASVRVGHGFGLCQNFLGARP